MGKNSFLILFVSAIDKPVWFFCFINEGYNGLQGIIGGYKGLQGLKGGYEGLQGILRG